jgi:biotin-dependent carboxylase-like uncharacterized protein
MFISIILVMHMPRPMDSFAFRVANRLVGNPSDAAALEVTYLGPTIQFKTARVVAICGGKCSATLDGNAVPQWQAFKVRAGQTLTIPKIDSGARAYIAFAGGLDLKPYLGSRATFPLGKLGPVQRELKPGDVLSFAESKSDQSNLSYFAPSAIPTYSNTWEVGAVAGPQEAPEYITEKDLSMLFSTEFEVSHMASRLGVRLSGQKPEFARPDGGEGGSHPSNLQDNAYAIGSINFTGDHPVVLTVDGPSLGGFICPITIPRSELWKIGQVKPGDKVRFMRMSHSDAVAAGEQMDKLIDNLSPPLESRPVARPRSDGKASYSRGLFSFIDATSTTPRVEYRIAGDTHLMVDYKTNTFDLNLRVRVHELERALLRENNPAITDTVPGLHSLMIQYNPHKLDLKQLVDKLQLIERSIPNTSELTFPSRVLHLPMAFRDKWSLAAISKYSESVRAVAPYVPDNVEFLARTNGISVEETERILYDASYMVMGLGDVYLGAPCAIPVDPRHRLSTPKYNPARTFSPEGAVGIGGSYMCIYPIESPGGYQLVGRTLPIWRSNGDTPHFTPEKPWLLDMFDQVRFYRVSEEELEKQRSSFSAGTLKLNVKEEEFSMKRYNSFVQEVSNETAAFRQKQRIAVESIKWEEEKIERKAKSREQVLAYLANQSVNGPQHPGAIYRSSGSDAKPISEAKPASAKGAPPPGLKQVFDKHGPQAFAKAVRDHRGLLLTDTTWRDAHQSLLATRVRSRDLLAIAPLTSHVLANAYSLEMWGGATFDVSLRFLHECPWERLSRLREQVPNIPFQMLIRGANALGYSSYPDNVIFDFCNKAKRNGMDVFRVFDSLNYIDNLKLGIQAVGQAGGIIEAVMCYTGDITDPNKTKYTLDYYMDLARKLVAEGIHVLCVKDMAGLLKPRAASILIGALRREFPDLPIHVHTHDTAGTGVASMLACAHAGADAVDCAVDAMSGLTAQPSMGAIVNELIGTNLDTGINPAQMQLLTSYWEQTRRVYEPFESGRSAGADVYTHEIPGGQYVNLQFQTMANGMADEWDNIRVAYAAANRILGDIVKVTPSSKVVGDLAQFMVLNKLSEQDVLNQADSLSFPASVVDYLQGSLGVPYGGFPEPFRSRVLKDLLRVNERPGLTMKPIDFNEVKKKLSAEFSEEISDLDVLSSIQFPAVFKEFVTHKRQYGNVSDLPTYWFFNPMYPGQQFSYTEHATGENIDVKLIAVKPTDKNGLIPVEFELNGVATTVAVKPTSASAFVLRGTNNAANNAQQGEKKVLADKTRPGSIGSPMPGRVVSVSASVGQKVNKGDTLLTISAMKMEIKVNAPVSGIVRQLNATVDSHVGAGELLVSIE